MKRIHKLQLYGRTEIPLFLNSFLFFPSFFSNIWHKQFVLWSWCDNKTINQVMLSPLNNTMVFPLFSQVVSWPSYTSWCRTHFLSGDLCFRCDSDYTFICKYSNVTSGPGQVQRQFFYLRLNCALQRRGDTVCFGLLCSCFYYRWSWTWHKNVTTHVKLLPCGVV